MRGSPRQAPPFAIRFLSTLQTTIYGGDSMKTIRILIALCVLCALASCSLKQGWDLAGKWQKIEGAETVEFTAKGTVILVSGETSVTAPYTALDAKHLQLNLGGLGTVVVGAEVAGDTLTLTDAKGQAVKYKKAK